MTNTYFYHDKPIFGLDVGHNSLKIMQIDNDNKRPLIMGYGIADFEGDIIKDGVITDPEPIAKAAVALFKKHLVGDITTHRVCMTIPAYRTYTRSMSLPKLGSSDLEAAVLTEAEQYIPMPIDELYIDHEVTNETDKDMEALAVAVPRKIADSYVDLANVLGLEVVSIESTISSASRLFVQAERSDLPTVLIDFGSLSTDITIYDKGIVVTGTVPGGGDSYNNLIMEALKVTPQEAHIIKTKYGLGLSKKQKEITGALSPILDQLVKEIRRMIRYYEERGKSEGKISQVVTMGGGANMPGLSEYLTSSLRLAVRMCDPWQRFDFHHLPPPDNIAKSMFVTVAGSALIDPAKVFKS